MSQTFEALERALLEQIAAERQRLDRLEQLARSLDTVDGEVLKFAIETFEGEAGAADWLLSQPMIMGDRSPLEHLQDAQGTERVKHSLASIRYGFGA